jgi:type I restriction enzyme, S subunit
MSIGSLSDQFAAWSVLEADRVAMPKINRNTLNELRLPVPTTPEQTAIADYLDRETDKIDRLVEKVEAAIGRLLEYRTALITAAVTGKIDVRQAPA